jgi:hypothetical protein
MGLTRRLSATVVATTLALAWSSFALGADARAATAYVPVLSGTYPDTVEVLRSRPQRFGIQTPAHMGVSFDVRQASWRGWGTSTATASVRGLAYANGAGAHGTPFRGTVRLTRPRSDSRCGVRIYRTMTSSNLRDRKSGRLLSDGGSVSIRVGDARCPKATASAYAVRDCPVPSGFSPIIIRSVRGITCAAALRDAKARPRSGGLGKARMVTRGGYKCVRLESGLSAGTYRCTRGSRAYRFVWGD